MPGVAELGANGRILASDLEGAEIAVVSVNLTSVTVAVLKY